VLLSSSRVQGNISNAITDWGTPVLVTVLALVVAAIVVVFALARRDNALARSDSQRDSVRLQQGGAASATGSHGATPDAANAANAAGTATAPGAGVQLTASPDVLNAIRKAASGR